jgi:diaminohydroxyphosphoribosylaminopyrimidine deaminase / 5-amino-6-(5-phosphoribosylamino)uracil reductase
MGVKAGRDDSFWMTRAIALARRAEGRTHPNPPVGAVIVCRGRCVGEGWHRKAGGAHAEVFALQAAGDKARGATLYVTLEPCSTVGRTPACTDALLRSGIRRVVIGARDPNPRHAGRGLRILRANGIEVEEDVLGRECRELIRAFACWITSGRPYVTLKLGLSLDGRIADVRGKSRWITGAASRAVVQRMRHAADAIMVGARTVLADNPSLQCRHCGAAHLTRVVVDGRGRVPATAGVFSDEAAGLTILATGRNVAPSDERLQRGASAWKLPMSGGRVSLKALLKRLGRAGHMHVICEGGGELASDLVRCRCADELIFFVAPVVLGGRTSVPAVGGEGWSLAVAPRYRIVDCVRTGDDVMVRAVPAADVRAGR